jgi:hypothetical protein
MVNRYCLMLACGFFQLSRDVICHMPASREEVGYCGDCCGAVLRAESDAGRNIRLCQFQKCRCDATEAFACQPFEPGGQFTDFYIGCFAAATMGDQK